MNTPLLVAATVFVGIAILIHAYIFVMESLTWSAPATWRRFGVRSQEDADTIQPMALNQGFYNLFLAIVTVIGIVAVGLGHNAVGAALVFAGVGSMLAAAVVLLTSSPDKARAAITQGAFPLIAVVLLAIGLL